MEYITNIIGNQFWFHLFNSALIFVAAYFIGLFLKSVLFRHLSKVAAKTAWKWDEPLVNNLRQTMIFWCLLGSIYFIKKQWNITAATDANINKMLVVIWGVSITIVLANIATQLISLYSDRIQQTFPLTNLTKAFARILIIIIGALMILHSVGISITPLLTTLGIGGLAVALALQDTLSNLFAGLYTTMSKNISRHDFIKLESGEEGYVEDVGWRATRIRMLNNNMVLIPNSKLAQSVLVNYSLMNREVSVRIDIGVHYNSNLDEVEKATLEVARQIQQTVPGAVENYDPHLRYTAFGESSVNFIVILRGKEYKDTFLLRHEFIKQLHQRYREKGIVIPYPVRAINYSQEKAPEMAADGKTN
ncbi:MAG: mechanosensitive ion channel family protein [Planctomycetota bacterium]